METKNAISKESLQVSGLKNKIPSPWHPKSYRISHLRESYHSCKISRFQFPHL